MKFSFSRIMLFLQVAAHYASSLQGKETKNMHAIRAVTESVKSAQKARKRDEKNVNIEFAAVNQSGHIIFDAHGNYCYTKEDQLKRITRLEELDEKEYAIQPYMSTDPGELTAQQIEAFRGFIIPQEANQPPAVTAELQGQPGNEQA